MKIIHFADLHIGSKFDRLPEGIKRDLSTKLRNAFLAIIGFASENAITTILMAGDIFDRNAVSLKDKKFFYDSIKANPGIDFYYVRGNHDSNSRCVDAVENLHVFDGLQTYVKGNVRIIGCEIEKDAASLYGHSPFTTDKFNILMLHGDIANPKGPNAIDIKRLKDKNVNYLALGHIHKRKGGTLEGIHFEYPGCVLGRGFDETGEKGFLVFDTDDESATFHPMSDVLFEQWDVPVNGMDEAKLKMEIDRLLGNPDSSLISEIRLTGKAAMDIDAEDLGRTFANRRLYLEIKNATKQALSYAPSEKENSLRNLFVNKILSDPSIDDDRKERIISYGLSKLMKEEE